MLLHSRNHGFAQVKRGVEIDVHNLMPFRHRHVRDGLVRPDGGIADQNVDFAKHVKPLRHHIKHLIRIGHVSQDG